MSKIVICAIDVEASGSNWKENGIIAIGLCAIDLEGCVLKKVLLKLQLEMRTFEQACWDRFWSKNLDKVDKLQDGAIPIKDALQSFCDIIDELDAKYELAICSDNPAFDFGFINYYLVEYLNRFPLSYKHNNSNNYRSLYDTDSYTRGAIGMSYEQSMWTSDVDARKYLKINENVIDDVQHDHSPDNDAHYIALHHLHVVKKAHELSIKIQ